MLTKQAYAATTLLLTIAVSQPSAQAQAKVQPKPSRQTQAVTTVRATQPAPPPITSEQAFYYWVAVYGAPVPSP